jgi:thioester reductase-like protein
MQLRNALQMTTADEDLMAMRSRDIGLDSLISVDIRSWFLKNFEVSVPVLKIMGNDTMADLAELVAEQVPLTLLPGIHDEEVPALSPTTEQPIPEIRVKDDDSSSSSIGNEGNSSVERSTASSETTSLANDLMDSRKGLVNIDWDAEINLPRAVNVPIDVAPASRPEIVVLTGASGLLGSNLLRGLLAQDSVKTVICIATRRLSERLNSKELLQSPRVQYFEGDLTQPRLGLSEHDALDIFSRADAVIHNGADTSHLKFYPEIKTANTGSTSDLIRYCIARKVPIHYVSTVGVALFGNFTSFPEVSVAAHNPPTDGSHGYVAAKWASERLLEQLQQQHDVNVWIHRPSTIIRKGTDATNAAAQIDWMNALVAYMRKTRAVPMLANLKGALDLVQVKTATDSILASVFKNEGRGEPTYRHQVGDVVVPLDRMKEYIEKETGTKEVQVLPVEQWTQMAVAAGLNRGVAALIDSMDDPGQPHYPRMLKEE